MTRVFAIAGCVFVLALSAPIGTDAHAAKTKWCAATGMDGKQTKWKCGPLQKCCYNWLAGKGMCVAASELCLFW
jgi:hypothetical protein